jgi:hypothetical protein
MSGLPPPRHIPTLPHLAAQWRGLERPVSSRFRLFAGPIEPRESTLSGRSLSLPSMPAHAPNQTYADVTRRLRTVAAAAADGLLY